MTIHDTTSRRFEIRYLTAEGLPDQSASVLGWHNMADGAERMAEAWRKRPGVTHAWVVDLQACRGGDFDNLC